MNTPLLYNIMPQRTAVKNVHPYFGLLNATRKMVTCSRHNQKMFRGNAPCA